MAAGQRATNKTEAAAIESGYLSFTFDPGTTQFWPLFLTERKIAVEAVNVRYTANNNGALTGGLSYGDDGDAMANDLIEVTPSAGTGSINFNTTINTKQAASLATGSGTYTAGKCPGYNVIPEDALLFWEFSAAPNANLGYVTVTIRYSTVIR